MPTTLTQHYSPACWRCGLRFANQPLLELHIREDHLEPRRRRAEPDRDDRGDARTPASRPVPEARPGVWAAPPRE
jgi:hypothetical protein